MRAGSRLPVRTWAGSRARRARFVPIYLEAAARYGLGARGPAFLAAIHGIETDFSQNVSVSSAGAIGHMQFMPETWDTYGVDADGDGVADPYDVEDAIHSAANYLRASGAPRDWRARDLRLQPRRLVRRAGVARRRALRRARGGGGRLVRAGRRPPALDRAVRLYEPREFVRIPAEYMATGVTDGDQIDARI